MPGLTREEALLIVKAEIQAVIEGWAGEKRQGVEDAAAVAPADQAKCD